MKFAQYPEHYKKLITTSVYCPTSEYMIKSLKIILVIAFVLGLQTQYSLAQITDEPPLNDSITKVDIKWTGTWPPEDQPAKARSLRNSFNSIVLGMQTPELVNPVAILANSPDDYLILDQANRTIFQISGKLGDIPQFMKKNTYDLASLVGICSGPNSSVLFTDSYSGQVFIKKSGHKRPELLNDSLKLQQPTGIAYLEQEHQIWVLETKEHSIAILDESGIRIGKIGKRGNAKGEFNFPTHIWADAKGLVYITDAMNFRVQVFNSNGEVVSVFGQVGDASGFMARPKGIATDSHGNIYVVDALFHTVQVFDLNGRLLISFGNQGHGNAEFWMPTGIFIDKQDHIFVADTYNSRVQIFQITHEDRK